MSKPKIGCCQIWVIKGLAASVFMAFGQFLFATRFSQEGIMASANLGPGTFLVLSLFKIAFAIKNKWKYGKFINPEKSNFFGEDGFKYSNLIPLAASFYSSISYVILFSFAYKFAKKGGLNQGVILIMTSLSTIYSTILFYFKFGEKTSRPKLLGMSFTFVCALCLAIDSSKKQGSLEDGTNQKLYSFYSLGLASLVPLGHSLRHFVTRKYQNTYETIFLPLDASLLETLVYSFMAIYSYKDLVMGAVTGLLIAMGHMMMSQSVAEGYAGPAQSLMSCNSIWMTILTTSIDKQGLSPLQIMALSFGVMGAFVIAQGDDIISRIINRK